MSNRDYYCNQKWTWLTVNLEKRLSHSCCSADPVRIDMDWLQKNPGKIFNTPLLQQERQDMLDNRPVNSCETACWKNERNGATSRRLLMGSFQKTHTSLLSSPEILNIHMGSTCNLTCSYCCKQYSSAWLRDLDQNGSYLDVERYSLNNLDRILLRVSQNELNETEEFIFLLDQLAEFDNIRVVRISGGEPFLYNSLPSLLDRLKHVKQIIITSGLGVNPTRFAHQLDRISNNNIAIDVSAETIENFYEFNRAGNTWKTFLENFKEIQSRNITTSFNSVVSNLTIFGLKEFDEMFNQYPINYNVCADPDFLSPGVLDLESKQHALELINQTNIPVKKQLISAINVEPTLEQHKNLAIYLREFARRKNFDLAIFPATMLQWLNTIEDTYVV